MPINGSIEEAGLADVLQLLSLGGKTGCLSVADADAHGEIFLDAGRVSYAEVLSHRDHFAEKLVKRGRITRSQLDTAIALRISENDRPLGHILVDSGHVEREEMEQLLRIQAQEAVYSLFAWKQGQFTFVTSRRPPYHAFAISLDPENLLLEGARRVDEWDLIRRKIPSFDLVYRRSGSSLGLAAAELTENQDRILPLLDGTRDVASIVDVTGMSEYDVGKALYGLVMAGFATLLERRSRVRHLEYRELLAYVVREAEYADPDRRKDAARHIADCPSCGKRLRNIHVRRTEGNGILALPVETLEETDEVDLDLAQAVGGETTGRVAGRIQDRRAGEDRRAEDRRRGVDRRRTQDPAWLQGNADRRLGSRRMGERRVPQGRYRRSDDYARGPVGMTTTPGFIVPGGGAAGLAAAMRAQTTAPFALPRRATDIRHPHPQRRPTPPAASPPLASPPELTPPSEDPATAATLETPVASPAAPEAAPPDTPEAAPPPEAAQQAAPPADAAPTPEIKPARRRSDPARPRTPSQDIIWLTTPEETRELAKKDTAARRQSGAYTPAHPSRSTPKPAAAASPPAPTLPLAPLTLSPAPLLVPLARPSRRSVPRLTERAARARTWRLRLVGAAGIAVMATAAAWGVMAIWGSPGGSLSATAMSAAPPPPPVSPHLTLPQASAAAAGLPAPESADAAASHVPEPVSVAAHPTAATAAAVVPGAVVATTDARAAARDAAKAARDSAATARRDSVAAAARERVAVAVAPLTPDSELAAGGWTPITRAEAASILGGALAQIQGLRIESITTSSVGGRPRVRVAQVARSGQRVVLTQMPSGTPASGARPYRPGEINVTPAEGMSIGTATLGGAFITARSSLGADELRQLLEKLGEAR